MKFDLRYKSIVTIGLISVFICGYLIDDYFEMGWFQTEVLLTNIFILPDTNKSHKCFKLFSNTSYFRSVVLGESSNKNSSCRLITNDRFGGRVGNQMFQVAAVIGMASDLDMIPVINIKHSLIAKYFNFPNTVYSDISNVVKCYEKGYAKYSNCLITLQKAKSKNLIVQGYRQSWKYFVSGSTYIRNVFNLKVKYTEKAKSFIASNSVLGHDNVCIHVRRGDKMEATNLAKGSAVADMDFLLKAMQLYKREFIKVRFIVLSDDIKWCKSNIKEDVTFSPYSDPGVDLAIMRYCDHVIVTSGTFGWWGAWLSNGTVVYYHGFPRNGSQVARGFDWDDYYPRNWIKL